MKLRGTPGQFRDTAKKLLRGSPGELHDRRGKVGGHIREILGYTKEGLGSCNAKGYLTVTVQTVCSLLELIATTSTAQVRHIVQSIGTSIILWTTLMSRGSEMCSLNGREGLWIPRLRKLCKR